jgi:hypothetical protein
MSSLGNFCDHSLYAPINAVASGGKYLPSHVCVHARLEGVFLLRNSIPRLDSTVRARTCMHAGKDRVLVRMLERISSTPFQCLYFQCMSHAAVAAGVIWMRPLPVVAGVH